MVYPFDFTIVSDFEDGLFHPEKSITRAEVAKVLVGILEMKGEI